MIKECSSNSRYFFKDSMGSAFIIDSIIDRQKDVSQKYLQALQRNESPSHCFEYCIPNQCELVDIVDDAIYNCSFSLDGRKFLVSTQRGMIIYRESVADEKQPFTKELDINSYDISWTITDADFSDNNKFLVHSTLNPILHCFDLEKMKYIAQFNLAPTLNLDSDLFFYNYTPIFSIKISGDNNELIAGCGKSQSGLNLKIFNIEKNKVTQSIKAHTKDINSITYLDRNSSALLLSASDDGYGKVWDMRALGMNKQCQGFLIGHHAGLTSISSRGDHVYCATNSKDQSLKVWDLRKLESSDQGKKIVFNFYDYRNQSLRESVLQGYRKMKPEEHFDNSVMTFYDHSVLRTLIRCHFSPESLSDGRYVYSGSACGRLFVWDIFQRKKVGEYIPRRNQEIMRDCTWHPFKPMILTTNFRGCIYKWEMDASMDCVKIEKKGESLGEESQNEGSQLNVNQNYSYESDEEIWEDENN